MSSSSSQKYEWSQTDGEVVVRVRVGTMAKDKIKVKMEAAQLTIVVAGESILKDALAYRIEPDDSFWSIEGEGDTRTLVISLAKKKDKQQWRGLTKEEEESVPGADVMAPDFDVLALEHDDDDPERVEEQEQNEIKLEARYKKLLEEKGIDDEATLQTFFALFDNCIQLYRLNKMYTYLQDVVPACRKRNDKYKLKAIQALAFVLWKQSKFKEALPLFHEMEGILGKGAALCENIAHTYNSMGNYDKAEEYFRQSLKFIEQEHGLNAGNRGGVLLGLGLVRDRLGRHREALPVIKQAYEFYKERARGAPASLQAKAGISCAKLHMKLGEMRQAEVYIREAVTMYEVTCGETSPLTASAYHELGKCLWMQRKREDAQNALARAYELEAMKDAWDLVVLLEIHNLLMDTHLKEIANINRTKFQEYFKIVDFVVGRVRKDLPQDGNAAVYYKAAGELKAWGGNYNAAKDLLNKAIPLFREEKSMDCSSLIQACNDMLGFCDRNLAGTQNSPMSFDIPTEKAQEAEKEPQDGPVIEEIFEDAESQAAADEVEELPAATFRLAEPQDFTQFLQLCRETGRNPLLTDQASFSKHLKNHGAGLCWAAVQGSTVCALALCGSDGIFAHVQQVLSAPTLGKGEEEVRKQLLTRCTESCREKQLRALRAEPSVAGERGGELLEALCWKPQNFIYTTPCATEAATTNGYPAASAAASSAPRPAAPPAPAPATAAAAPAPAPAAAAAAPAAAQGAPAANGNVARAMAAEDGGEPAGVPENMVPKEDFGPEGEGLELPTKITKYSWDQSNLNVSLYIPFDGVGSLPEQDVECVFRPKGVLLVIKKAGKRHWYKMPNLCREIDPASCSKKIKADQVVMKLKKVEKGETWSDLSDEKDRYQRQREYRIQHGDLKGATTEQLLADMYANANDEERAGLRDAMRVNREKRQEEAKGSS
mmetsp:Transcript_79613/g.165369  ORF Transcript_79613/g.165369 Transcript_79613/m.165369 type:complete len:941 (-) Transcript_79613:78-2900(-)|eukprot:CAMPEP_0206451010 /NCGR_PEP_ID=MMETSP0324_2-20121206/19078_1 /ASSEMBLY_ACC=CAM_ASM_000836 /TAXON_ID=2866 /ORGANISM="Crypthecodinium cohnii, Strain Seligo" /LENGTH=940 /DNA_ID=CAMNT_0053920793 /DNA_START=67 /DNA_END=2889 /DNA_ORIENTATION=+